jgi:hypothetical protein
MLCWFTYHTAEGVFAWRTFGEEVGPEHMSKHFVLANQNIFKTSFDEKPKTPPFPIIIFLPHKRVVFAISGF